MSTGIVHQPDTPVSSGSPSSVGIEASKSDCFDKNDEFGEDRSSCSPVNEDCHSGSSSPPQTTTPTLSFTPPVNGILTPPNDADIVNDSGKSANGSGRLKFYKDGVLCLELSHHDEGEKRKWVQIRSKTVFPTVVHTKKEVVIPRHVSPTPSFHSSVTNNLQQRLESSASHSTSDDGSSMLSSPRIRESSWRKPVPKKGISVCLEFYLKPAPCTRKCRQYSELYQSRHYRKPFSNFENIIDLRKTHSLKCSCDISSLAIECETVDSVDGNNSKIKPCDQEHLSPVNVREKRVTTKSSILELVQRLHCENERHLKLANTKLIHRSDDHNDRKGTDQPTVSKKRSFRETDMKDSSSLHPPKLSPKSKSVKTILNIPGFNNEFCKRTTTPDATESDKTTCTGQLVDNNLDLRYIRDDPSHKRKSSSRHQDINKNYGSCNNTTKIPPRKSPHSPKHSTSNSGSIQSAMYLSSLPPEQQQIFQQQTMSKAISYTINSLLSPHNQESSRKLSAKSIHHQGREKAKPGKSKALGTVPNPMHHANYFGVKGDHDQNSFLRHLLDTSDPIPNPTGKQEVLPVPHSNKGKQSQSPTSDGQLQSHPHQSTLKHADSFSRKLSSKPKQKLSPVQPTPQQFQHQMGFFPPTAFMQPSLFGAGFPLHLRGYESLFAGQHPSVGALAAAAELQYQSLIPPNFLQQMNPSMAAAMAASYLGASQISGLPPTSGSGSTLSTRSPPTSRRSENYQSNRNTSKSIPLNLSQREMSPGTNGGISGTASIPVPFHAPTSDNPHSHIGSATRTASLRGRLPKANDTVDDDVPLNLSKKT